MSSDLVCVAVLAAGWCLLGFALGWLLYLKVHGR